LLEPSPRACVESKDAKNLDSNLDMSMSHVFLDKKRETTCRLWPPVSQYPFHTSENPPPAKEYLSALVTWPVRSSVEYKYKLEHATMLTVPVTDGSLKLGSSRLGGAVKLLSGGAGRSTTEPEVRSSRWVGRVA
jgi:hypothetical protein